MRAGSVFRLIPGQLVIAVAGMLGSVHANEQIHAAGDEVNVVLKEWRINVDKTIVKPGPVKFSVMNRGKEKHELVIVKTHLAVDQLPMLKGKVDEDKAGEVIGEIEEFEPDKVAEATFSLSSGRYILFCNLAEEEHGKIESHFSEGMRISLVVE